MDLCSVSGRNLQADLLCRNRIQRPKELLEGQVSLTDGDANYMGSREGMEIHEIQKPKGELEETLVRHPGGFGEGKESSMHGSVHPCGHLYRAWLPSEALPVKTGSDHPELFLF